MKQLNFGEIFQVGTAYFIAWNWQIESITSGEAYQMRYMDGYERYDWLEENKDRDFRKVL